MIEKTRAIKSLSDILSGYNNPTGQSWATISSFANDVLATIIDIAGVVAFIMIMYGGILYMTAMGQEAKIETAKKTLIWSIVGLVLVLLSRVIIGLLKKEL